MHPSTVVYGFLQQQHYSKGAVCAEGQHRKSLELLLMNIFNLPLQMISITFDKCIAASPFAIKDS